MQWDPQQLYEHVSWKVCTKQVPTWKVKLLFVGITVLIHLYLFFSAIPVGSGF